MQSKLASIVGARPEFIKLFPIVKETRRAFDHVVIHTGQHYDYKMDGIFFGQLNNAEPDHRLRVGSGTHVYQIAEMLRRLEKVLLNEKPHLVIVYGDTNSTLAGALASTKLGIPLVHVEAGLRSFDRRMPEEANRVVVDHLSDVLFAPTKAAVVNLEREGISRGVWLTGDVNLDATLHFISVAERESTILSDLRLQPKKYLLVTVHRESNVEDRSRLENIVHALADSGEQIVFPVHPRTARKIREYGLNQALDNAKNVRLIEPLGFLDMLRLESNAKKIITDSGGVQKEAYILKVPAVTLRENTEWVETVEEGWNILVGTDNDKILEAIRDFKPVGVPRSLYGNGNAAQEICKILEGLTDTEGLGRPKDLREDIIQPLL